MVRGGSSSKLVPYVAKNQPGDIAVVSHYKGDAGSLAPTKGRAARSETRHVEVCAGLPRHSCTHARGGREPGTGLPGS
jgi:hypothetical protein